MKKYFIQLISISLFAVSFSSASMGSEERVLKLSAPPEGLLALPFYVMQAKNVLAEKNITLKFVPWRNQEQLRSVILGKYADIIGMHTAGAALMYSKGVKLKMMTISLDNVLSLITDSNKITELKDLKGKVVAVPFKDELPDILFRLLINQDSFLREDDITIRYTSSSRDSANLLAGSKVKAALIAEPHASILLQKGGKKDIPLLYRSIDFNYYVKTLVDNAETFPSAGIVALSSISENDEILAAFWDAYLEASIWCLENPLKALEFSSLSKKDKTAAKGLQQAMSLSFIKPVKAFNLKDEISLFIKKMALISPKRFSRIMLDDEFYWQGDK